MRRVGTSPEARPIALARQSGRRGLFAVLGVVVIALATFGIGCNDVEQGTRVSEQDPVAMPREVRDALDRAALMYPVPLSGARWSGFSRMTGTDHPVYQVRGTNGRGNKIEAEVTSAGRIIEVEEHGILLDEVPSAVIDALKIRMPESEPTQIEAIYQAEKIEPVCYGFEGKDANGRKIEIYISADGKTFLN